MSASKLKPTGTCYKCGKPVPGKRLFCNKSCHGTYYNANMRAKNRQDAIDARIDAIVDRDTGGKPQWYLRQYTATLAPAA